MGSLSIPLRSRLDTATSSRRSFRFPSSPGLSRGSMNRYGGCGGENKRGLKWTGYSTLHAGSLPTASSPSSFRKSSAVVTGKTFSSGFNRM